MATPRNAPKAGEIWHLSIEDLFQPVTEAQRLGGDGPFVINLSVSTAPIDTPAKVFDACRDAHIYQIQVTEDGRTRYRLRLGPFASEDQADAVLADVRETYPGALTATAGTFDLRAIASMQPQVEPKKSDVQIPAPASDLKAAGARNAEDAAVKTLAGNAASSELESEISIDIAWPTAERVLPPRIAPHSGPGVTVTVPPSIASPPTSAAPLELALEWSLPELDLPFPKAVMVGGVANSAPLLTEAVAAEPKLPSKAVAPVPARDAAASAPIPIAVHAPVLTEAVVLKPRAKPIPVAGLTPIPAPSTVAPIKAAAAVVAAPVAVAPVKAAPVKAAPVNAAPVKAAAVAPRPSMAPKAAAAASAAGAPSATPVVQKPAKPSIFSQAIASALKTPTPTRRPDLKAPASSVASLRPVLLATAPTPPAREVKKLDRPLESLEHTQTVRALTSKELEDIETSRWFVIQLALADRAFDPDAVPNLDIFSEYRLYSVAGLDQGRVVHALRLGFFREEIGAVAVASYLAAYWNKPSIKRVSLAERERFANQKIEARKDVDATGKHTVIEITDELVAPRKRPLSPAPAASAKSFNQPVGR